MRRGVSYRLLLLVGVLSVSIFSLNTFVVLPSAVVPDQPQQLLLQSAFGTFPGENGKIAFTSDGSTNPEISVMNPDGSGQTRLSDNPAADVQSDWSPDGTKLVFLRERGLIFEFYVMNPDGSGQTRLTTADRGIAEQFPVWSPDGTKIAFSSTRDGNGEIYVMDADGSNQRRLTTDPAWDSKPSWSPDGTKIAFSSTRDGDTETVFVMNADGSEQTRLTTPLPGRSDHYPDWSPDGTKIAFTSERDIIGSQINSEIYVMNADGSGQINLSNSPAWETEPSWSPDGTKIAYAVRVDNVNSEIYVMNADGSEQTRLTDNEVHDSQPDWGSTSAPPPELDTSPPVLTVPEDIVVNATTANGGTVVTYSVSAEDNVDGIAKLEEDGSLTQDDIGGNIAISCDPPSGSEFPVGETVVECTATDAAGNSDTESFMVTVNPPTQPPPPPPTTPREAIERLISYIENLEDVPESAKTRLTSVLERALALLTDNNARNDASACNMLGSAFINQVNATERRGSVTEDQAAELRTQVEDIRDLMGC